MTATALPKDRPLRADARRNWEKIVAAAREAFAAHGVDASLDEVARAARVGPGTLYRHFPTREHLLAAVLGDSMLTLLTTGERLAREMPPLPALRAWMRAVIEHTSTYQGLATPVLAAAARPERAIIPGCAEMRRLTADLLAAAQAAGAVRRDVTATEVLALCNALAWAAEQTRDCGTDRGRLLDHVVHGIVVPGAAG